MALSQAEAVTVAKEEAARRGWDWLDPVQITRRRRWVLWGRGSFEIRTNADKIGRNAVIEVCEETGRVLRAGWLPR